MPEPSEEVDPYNDFMTTDIEEEYAKLTYKMYERRGHRIGSEHFLHVYGPTYIRCADCTAKNVASFLRMLGTEDVTFGHWLLDIAMSVQHGDDRAICDPHSSVPTYISCSVGTKMVRSSAVLKGGALRFGTQATGLRLLKSTNMSL